MSHEPGANAGTGLIARLIAASAHRPFITILFVAALSVWGWVSLQRAPLDAGASAGAGTGISCWPVAIWSSAERNFE